MEHFRIRWAVLLISIIFLSSCGGSTTSTPTALSPEGTATAPVPLTVNTSNPPTNINSGQVGNTSTGSKSYYQASVTSGDTYTITLYGLSADADLWVYNNRPFDYIAGPVCKSQNGGTSNEQCVVTAIGSTMNIEIDGQYSLSGATYSISLVQIALLITPASCGSSGICFDLESGMPAFTLSGTGTSWVVDGLSFAHGANSIHSSGLTDSQNVCFSYAAATTSATNPYVTFNLSTSSTPYYDLLLFYIDNVLQLPVWSGSESWQNVMFNTSSGTHTYKWCHSYTGSVPSGDVWVDDIYIQ